EGEDRYAPQVKGALEVEGPRLVQAAEELQIPRPRPSHTGHRREVHEGGGIDLTPLHPRLELLQVDHLEAHVGAYGDRCGQGGLLRFPHRMLYESSPAWGRPGGDRS